MPSAGTFDVITRHGVSIPFSICSIGIKPYRSFVRLLAKQSARNVNCIEINRIRTGRCWAISMDTVRNSHAFSCSGQFARAVPSQGARATSSTGRAWCTGGTDPLPSPRELAHHTTLTLIEMPRPRDVESRVRRAGHLLRNSVRWGLFRPFKCYLWQPSR